MTLNDWLMMGVAVACVVAGAFFGWNLCIATRDFGHWERTPPPRNPRPDEPLAVDWDEELRQLGREVVGAR